MIRNKKYSYSGEVDEEDNACGLGVAIKKGKRIIGTFYDNKLHGICKT